MKKALITGVSRGIGLAISKKLLKENFKVYGLARTKPDFKDDNFYFFQGNINNQKFRKYLKKEISELDLLILNAGVGYFEYLPNLKDEKIEEMINTNLLSPILLVKDLLPLIKKSQGNIIFIGSESALKTEKSGAVYSASKAGIRMFAQGLMEECRQFEVKTTVINPGMIDNSFFDDKNFHPEKSDLTALRSEDVADVILDILKRRKGLLLEEINFSPLKKSIKRGEIKD